MSESKQNRDEERSAASPYRREPPHGGVQLPPTMLYRREPPHGGVQLPPKRVIVHQGTIEGFGVWALDDKGLLTIDGKGRMPDWDSQKQADGEWHSTSPWVTFRASIQRVKLSPGVTSIGESAFSCCSSLKSVTIPDSVTSIGAYAFYGCKSLKSVTIPEGVTSIGNFAFAGCSSLTSVTIPEGVTSIGDWAFGWCSSLTSVTIPNSVTILGANVFWGCGNMKGVKMPGRFNLINVAWVRFWWHYGIPKKIVTFT